MDKVLCLINTQCALVSFVQHFKSKKWIARAAATSASHMKVVLSTLSRVPIESEKKYAGARGYLLRRYSYKSQGCLDGSRPSAVRFIHV